MTGILNFLNKILKHLPVVLFIVYYGSTTMFPHIHYVDNEIIIIHSHPFKKEAGQYPVTHHHSTAEFLLIQYLTNSLSLTLLAFTILLIVKIVLRDLGYSTDEAFPYILPFLNTGRLRAPPVFPSIGREIVFYSAVHPC